MFQNVDESHTEAFSEHHFCETMYTVRKKCGHALHSHHEDGQSADYVH